MKTVLLLVLTYLSTALAAGRGSWTGLGDWEPAWLPMMLAVVLVCTSGRSTLLWAMLLGLLDDALAYGVLGVGLLSYTFIAAFAQPLVRWSLRFPTLMLPVAVFCLVGAVQFSTPFLRDLLQARDHSWLAILWGGLFAAASSAAVCLNLTSLAWTIHRIFRTVPRDAPGPRLNLWRLLPH